MSEIRKNFLTKVLFRIDFSEPMKIPSETIDEVKTKIQDRLPKFNKGLVETIEVIMGPDEQRTVRKKREVFDFKNEDETEWIHIEDTAVWLEVSKYSTFNHFERLINDVLTVLSLKGKSARLGLRYINQITINEGDPFDWKGWINSNLLNPIEFVNNKETLARVMGVIIYNLDEYQMKFQYGMYNSEFPNPIAKREFVLDYDCSTKEPRDYNETLNLLNIMHDLIKGKFKESIGSEIKKIIEEDSL